MNRRTWITLAAAVALAAIVGGAVDAAQPDTTIPDVCVRAFANADRGFELAAEGAEAILYNEWDRLDTITAQLEANPYATNRDRCLEETK